MKRIGLLLFILSLFIGFANAQQIDFEQIRAKAKAGDISSQYNMGVYYHQQAEYKQAVKWYKKAAEKGHMFAQCNLGSCYEKGEGVAQDYEQAAFWYAKAAKQGDCNAQNNLGNLYDDGLGVKRNPQKAFRLYLQSAQQGHAPGQYNLAYCYYLGKGVKQSTEQALQWFQAAADQGVEPAQRIVKHIQENPTNLLLQPAQ